MDPMSNLQPMFFVDVIEPKDISALTAVVDFMSNLHPIFSADFMILSMPCFLHGYHGFHVQSTSYVLRGCNEPKDILALTAVIKLLSNLCHVFSMDDLDFISNIRPISSVNDQSTSYVLNGCNGA